MTLDEIAKKYSTDKCSNGHSYTQYYEMLFGGLRNSPLKLLEIGVKRGCSLRMWKEYFPNAQVFGVDITPRCKSLEEDRIKIFIGGQDDPSLWKSVESQVGMVDILIDDGSHMSAHQIASLDMAFRLVKPGGFYVIEDLQCSYAANYIAQSPVRCIDYLKTMVDKLNVNGAMMYGNKAARIARVARRASRAGRPLTEFDVGIEAVMFFPYICFIKKMSGVA